MIYLLMTCFDREHTDFTDISCECLRHILRDGVLELSYIPCRNVG